MNRLLLVCGALCLLAGCSSWTLSQPPAQVLRPETETPARIAKICVVRTSILASAVTFPTHDNAVLVGATQGPTFFCYYAEPGVHEIAIEADETEKTTIRAEPGKTYFLKQEVENILGYVKCRAVWLDEPAGRSALRESTHRVLTAVPASETVPPAAPLVRAKGVDPAL